jgi:hypothetical protein
MNDLETQIAEWRTYVANSPAINGHDVEELESHLRDQIADLDAVGLDTDEAFLVAVKRMGGVDSISREFAREHSARLWKQLVLDGDDDASRPASGWVEAVAFALAAAVVIQVARLIAGFPDDEPVWFARNLSLFVLPLLAGYFAYRRRLDVRAWMLMALPFGVAAILVNVYPFGVDSDTEVLVALHLPVALWFVVAYPYMSGTIGSHERRMDFVRFTGEWFIYYVLIALGGGVLVGLTGLILQPISEDLPEQVASWVLPSGAAGAVIIAAWLVEAKQQVVENMAPVLTMVFTPLFAVMLPVAAVTYALFGLGDAFDRELLGVFDAVLVVVLGLVLYSTSARDAMRPPGLMDRIQLLTAISALVLDVMALGSMVARIGDQGVTPNRAATLGLNVVLLVNLAGGAWLLWRFVSNRLTFHRVERWQTTYLPVFALWAAAVVAVIPPVFGFD